MSRLSREQQQEQQRDGAPPAAPVDVRVFAADGSGGGSGDGTAPGPGAVTVDGTPLLPAPGEEPQQSVLNHLHRIALSTGRPVLATIHDERIGYVVPLQVDPDGSSRFTNRPSRTHPSPAPAPAPAVSPGAAAHPTGTFGPPPVMATEPHPAPLPAPTHPTVNLNPIAPAPKPTPAPASTATPTPTPPRGFDAVAEAVLGDDAPEPAAERTPLTEPLARIGEAVKEGRIDDASTLADQALRDGTVLLGPEHPEMLRLGELTAYVAYLAGDPLRAFRLSVDLVHARRRTGDAEAAYGNVQSAATAWRAVRDPLRGLDLGNELIALWSALAAEPGPAAEDAEQLRSARSRMTRLAERARKAAAQPLAE
ncbi:MAG TPA: tetratricopeptide repeat protein [Streptomyces sp.]|nr:tetratricopeptide repeat protein [Streptomyces sp.]